jgi:hypothetical protein
MKTYIRLVAFFVVIGIALTSFTKDERNQPMQGSRQSFVNNNISGTLTITYPNGGEILFKGTTIIITWTSSTPFPPEVRLELWKGGAYFSVINPSAPNTGSCYWAIQPTVPNGNDYKVKILPTTNTIPFDFSDNYFTITGGTIPPNAVN